jgi:hypothetical protein
MLERLHESYLSIVSLQDKQPEADQGRQVRTAENSNRSKIFLRSVSSRNVKQPRNAKQAPWANESRERSSEVSKQLSFLDVSSREGFKVRGLEHNYHMQVAYNTQLRLQLQEAKAEADQFQRLLENLEQSVYQAHRSERGRWSSFLVEFKVNCEAELIRKHEELTRLHNQVTGWVEKYDSKNETSVELRQILKSPKEPDGLTRISELMKTSPMWSQSREVGGSRLGCQGGDTSVWSEA